MSRYGAVPYLSIIRETQAASWRFAALHSASGLYEEKQKFARERLWGATFSSGLPLVRHLRFREIFATGPSPTGHDQRDSGPSPTGYG
jgi:hypothetical protein